MSRKKFGSGMDEEVEAECDIPNVKEKMKCHV